MAEEEKIALDRLEDHLAKERVRNKYLVGLIPSQNTLRTDRKKNIVG